MRTAVAYTPKRGAKSCASGGASVVPVGRCPSTRRRNTQIPIRIAKGGSALKGPSLGMRRIGNSARIASTIAGSVLHRQEEEDHADQEDGRNHEGQLDRQLGCEPDDDRGDGEDEEHRTEQNEDRPRGAHASCGPRPSGPGGATIEVLGRGGV